MAKVIGLTGGIASGKSTVAQMLRELGAPVVDADQVARDVVAPGQPALDELVRAFGADLLLPDGTLDRKRLGQIAFGDPQKRAQLNAITHPRIAAASQAEVQRHRDRGAPIVFYEAALLVENGLHHALDGLLVVAAQPEVQLARTMARDGLTERDARARIAAQAPLADKIAAADHVIYNDGDLGHTRRQVEDVYRTLKGST